MGYKKEIETSLQNMYGGRGITGLVELMQLNYNMRNIEAFVSASGNQITVDLRSANLVEGYRTLKHIVENSGAYTFNEYMEATTELNTLKKNLSQLSHQSRQDRDMFIAAKVSRVTFSIGGDAISNADTGIS